tara:strand:- start:78 stop:1088 length:1011 start_codon:yes stop_codon:yes gene_type:complete
MQLFTLENKNGMKMKVSSLGGIVMELWAPDRDGKLADVVLGFDSIGEYDEESPFFGALIGRFGNRISKGKYSIDGKEYSCAINNGENSLHGGQKGFDKVDWDVREISGEDYTGIEFGYLSKDGEEGFPGSLDVNVVYKLTDDNEWVIEYNAITDKPTIINLTQHSYFNLGGHDSGDCLEHEVFIDSDAFVVTDAEAIPTGEIRSVEGTPFDFRSAKTVGADIGLDYDQLEVGSGYDHTFVLDKDASSSSLVASVFDPNSGRSMDVYTTEPGVQFYAGNHLEQANEGKGGAQYIARSGICFETQHYPDSPNQPTFPSVRLDPGQEYESTTVYRFGAR